MSLTGASPVTTFLPVLRQKCSDTPRGYQEHYGDFQEHLQTLYFKWSPTTVFSSML